MRKITSIINFTTTFFKEETQKILLGRWSINYCPIKIKKILMQEIMIIVVLVNL